MLRILGTVVLFLSTVYLFSSDNEIVVTGNRVPQEAASASKNITVIDSDELEEESSVVAVLEKNTGVHVVSTSGNDSYVTMGGFGENGYGRVLILIDGIAVNSPDMRSFNLNSISVESIERIEILEGAASARYGDQAVAGVINIITKKESGYSYSLFSSVNDLLSNTEGGSFSYRNDAFGISLLAQREQFFVQRDNSDSDSLNAVLKSDVSVNDFSVNADITYNNYNMQMPGGISEAQFEANPDQSNNAEDTATGYSLNPLLKLNYESGDFKLYLPLSYTYDFNSVDMTSWASYFDRSISAIDSQLISSISLYPSDSSGIELIGGIDFKRQALEVVRYVDKGRDAESGKNELVRLNVAPWAQIQYSFNDIFLIEAGGRYEYSDLTVSGDDANGTIVYTPYVFDASIAFFPVENFKLYVSGGQVYRYPFLDEQVSYQGFGSGINSDLSYEYGLSFSGGVVYNADNMRLSADGFVTFMEDEIYFSTLTFTNENMNETLHAGASFDVLAELDIFTLKGGYGYTLARFSNGDNNGKNIPLVPNHKVTCGFEVELPADIILSTDMLYTSAYYAGGDDANALEADYARLGIDAGINWNALENISLEFEVTNITDDRTPSQVYYSSFSSSFAYYPVEGRRFNIRVKWTY